MLACRVGRLRVSAYHPDREQPQHVCLEPKLGRADCTITLLLKLTALLATGPTGPLLLLLAASLDPNFRNIRPSLPDLFRSVMYQHPHLEPAARPGPPPQNSRGLFIAGTIATDATDGKAEEKLSLASSATARLPMGMQYLGLRTGSLC